MKLKTYSIAVLLGAALLIANSANAQWSLTGNAGTNASTNFIGTTDNVAFKVRTKNAVRVTVTGSGNVGIGTGSPKARLEVAANAAGSVTPSFRAYQSNCGAACGQVNGSALQLVNSNTSGVENGARMSFADPINVTNNDDGASSISLVNRNSASGYGGLGFSTRNATGLGERMRINANGNVGVGTASPSAQLHTTGTVRLQGLSGGGNRAVKVDADGNLFAGDNVQLITSTNDSDKICPVYTGTPQPVTSYITLSGLPTNVSSSSISITIQSAPPVQITLYAPNGDAVGIFSSSASYNLSNETFTDEAVATFPFFPTPHNGNTWKPSPPGFNGLGGGTINPNGTWSLVITSYNPSHADGITGWSIKVKTGLDNYLPKWKDGSLQAKSNVYDDGINVGIGTKSPTEKLTVYNGTTTGTYTTSGWVSSSDAKLKTNIKPLESALDKITKLQGVSYNWKNNPEANGQIGFIAQEVEKVFPEVVVIDKNGNYGLAPQNLTAPIIESIKELNKKLEVKDAIIDDLQKQNASINAQLNDMKSCVESLCSASTSNAESRVDVANETDALFQNQPNPFNSITTIRYSVVKGNAQIIIRDLSGNTIKSFNLAQSGKGQVTVNANELAQGTYTYTLVVNENAVDTKLMVITK
ncbi:MAG: tail fiber domain-containing protein [Bacteroidia bacterium]